MTARAEAPPPATPPVVLVAYNRPELVAEVLASVRAAAPAEVFVVADGPRAGDPEDAARCAGVRRTIEQAIDWPCTVHRRYQEQNRGVEETVELGLDWVFEQTDSAVVLEDDCIADPTFFRFCGELLERFADDDRVMMVSGTLFGAEPAAFEGRSYQLTTFSITWGWATWRRAWQRHRSLFPRDWRSTRPGQASPDAPVRVGPERPAPGALVTRAGARYFAEVGRSKGQEFGWDSHWFLTQVTEGALAVAPAVNLVHNAGFGADATHTVSTRRMPRSEPVGFPLAHPVRRVRHEGVQRGLERALVHANGRLARSVRRLVPRGRLRAWGRAAAAVVLRIHQPSGGQRSRES